MLGCDDEYVGALERAHSAYLDDRLPPLGMQRAQ
jgi:hypothetical protein